MEKRLSKFVLYTYGVPDLFFALMINMEAYFFASFLTDHAQFSLVLAGNVLGLTSLIDIACALAGGLILQKVTLNYGGKYRSWFLIGPPLIAPLFILQFTKIGNDLTAAAIVTFGFVSSHLLFNVVISASGALLGRLSPLPDERTVLSASRAQGMSAAGLLFSATAMPMILFFGERTSRVGGFTLTVTIYAVLMILGYWFIYRVTAGRDPYDEESVRPVRGESSQSVREIATLVLKNPPLLFLALAQVFGSTAIFVITAFAVYFFTYVAGTPAFLSVFILATSSARLIGTFFAPWIGVRLGKRHAYCVFLVLAAAGYASARLVGGSPWGVTLIFCVSSMLASVAAAMSTALFADTVVFGEWKTGKNIRAFTMALMNLPIKIGVLVRSAIVTAGLMTIGFVANSTPTPRVIEGISSIMTFTPALAYAAAAAIFFFGYRLTESQILEMQEEINERKSRAAAL